MEQISFFIVIAAIVGIAAFQVLKEQAELRKLRKMDYSWYARKHPDCIKGQRVVCFACGSNSLRVERLMRRTFTRKHFCGRCGKSLYYSEEA